MTWVLPEDLYRKIHLLAFLQRLGHPGAEEFEQKLKVEFIARKGEVRIERTTRETE